MVDHNNLQDLRENKMKTWSTDYADKKFRELILARDRVCQRCGKICSRLEVSHFFPRNNSATRFDPANVEILGFSCHWGNAQGWEFKKQTDYRDFKIRQLGQERYDELVKRSNTLMPREKAIKNLMKMLSEVKP